MRIANYKLQKLSNEKGFPKKYQKSYEPEYRPYCDSGGNYLDEKYLSGYVQRKVEIEPYLEDINECIRNTHGIVIIVNGTKTNESILYDYEILSHKHEDKIDMYKNRFQKKSG